MTTDTDKLVEMARERGAFYSAAARGWLTFRPDMLADFRAAIIADLAADVEPVAHMWQHDETGRTGFVEHAPAEELEQWERINKPRRFVAKLYSASTVAALKAENEALRARVAELEKDAARYRWLRSVPNAFKAQRIVNDTPHGMDATIDAAMNGGNQ